MGQKQILKSHLINIFNGSWRWYYQHHSWTIHSTKIPGVLTWAFYFLFISKVKEAFRGQSPLLRMPKSPEEWIFLKKVFIKNPLANPIKFERPQRSLYSSINTMLSCCCWKGSKQYATDRKKVQKINSVDCLLKTKQMVKRQSVKGKQLTCTGYCLKAFEEIQIKL